MKKLLLAGILMMTMLPVGAVARGHGGGHRGGGYHHGGFSHGVVVVPRFGYGFGYGWGDPYWGYPYQPYVYSNPSLGKVKLETKAKDAEVYINGSLAGTVGDLKSLSLDSGSYTIELRDPDGGHYEEQVYVLAGKTIHLHPDPDLRDSR